MKTTLELPDELMRAVKVRAAQSNRRLKDVVAELLERGIASQEARSRPSPAPKPVRLKGPPLTIEDIESAINSGRD